MYFGAFKTPLCGKRSGVSRKDIFERVPNKKGAGRFFAPHNTPFSALRQLTAPNLGRQNLAALSTAAGENLAAVGSSHSLAETVNLGSVATVRLIGTLHWYTSCHIVHYAQQQKPRQHIVFDHTWSFLCIIAEKHKKVNSFFLFFRIFYPATPPDRIFANFSLSLRCAGG